MTKTLHLARFGGGVTLMGAADTRGTDEIGLGDSIDIGSRGALVAASDITDYASCFDAAGAAFYRTHGLVQMSGFGQSDVLVVGEGADVVATPQYLYARIQRTGGGNAPFQGQFYPTPIPLVDGCYVTSFSFPGQFQICPNPPIGVPILISPFFVNIGAREGIAPNLAPGLFVMYNAHPGDPLGNAPIVQFDALGTGPWGQLAVNYSRAGAASRQLYFRGVVTYNNHAFGWGFDSQDTTYGDGPNRVMFCNVGDPLTWGNDNAGDASADRVFTDSDAIVLGDAGELIRAALSYNGRLYFGTDRGLHFISGYGRDSFITDGATPVMKAYNVIGPHALIEGPDRLMYGVSDQGLWSFDGQGAPVPLFEKLRDLNGYSAKWWDLFWRNPADTGAYPGVTNQDLVWMAVDWQRQQVLVGIPFCNSSSTGKGNDTVVIRYHPTTGGFTRQAFRNVALTAAGYFRRTSAQPETRFLATATAGRTTVQRYAFQATPASRPVMPAVLPSISFGPYAPFTADGEGVVNRLYLVLSWDSTSALPFVFRITSTMDQSTVEAFLLSIQSTAPAGPVLGDLWLDTSQTDTNIGNGNLSSAIPATGGYLLKLWNGRQWSQQSGQGGRGLRATIPLPLVRRVGTRVEYTVTTLEAAGRFTLEGLGMEPGSGEAAA